MVQATFDGDLTTPARRELWEVAAEAFTSWRVGEPEALDRLVRLLTPALWQLARSYRLNQRSAEDAVQNAWMALVRNADSIRDPQSIMAWMTVTTRREAWRQAQREHLERPAEGETLETALAPAASHECTVLDRLAASALWRHVERLPERCQHLLRIIAFVPQPNYASISARFGMPVGSIGPTRRRCLEKLRELLTEDPTWSDA
jgi:RNA polymerase sigma factor (sigma-70 family)